MEIFDYHMRVLKIIRSYFIYINYVHSDHFLCVISIDRRIIKRILIIKSEKSLVLVAKVQRLHNKIKRNNDEERIAKSIEIY
jgi:hypothetical protein